MALKKFFCFLVICMLVSSSCCFREEIAVKSKKRHFIQWDSYLGYIVNEDIIIDLAYIAAAEDFYTIENISYISLDSNKGDILVEAIDVFSGTEISDYSLETLSLTLEPLNIGTYYITGVEIREKDEKKSSYYDIGNWTLDIRDTFSGNIEYGKCSYVSNVFENFFCEIINKNNKDIKVEGIYFHLKNKTPEVKITESKSFDVYPASGSNIIPSLEMRYFNFQFLNAKDILFSNFVAIKPFLCYTKDGEEFYAPMNTAIYNSVYTDDDILEIMNN